MENKNLSVIKIFPITKALILKDREHGSGGALGGEHGSEYCGGTMAAARNRNESYRKGEFLDPHQENKMPS
jgi:hypothetical protein